MSKGGHELHANNESHEIYKLRLFVCLFVPFTPTRSFSLAIYDRLFLTDFFDPPLKSFIQTIADCYIRIINQSQSQRLLMYMRISVFLLLLLVAFAMIDLSDYRYRGNE